MRTKSVLLSAIVGALSGVSLMAQVYSLNVVGYVNVTCPPGFSIIANQLVSTNNNISPLLDSQLLDGNHNGVELFKYNTSGSFTPFTATATGWSTVATGTTLNPGEAAFIYNPFSTNFTLTFVGQVPAGSAWATNELANGFNLVSSIVPQSGALDTALGLVPAAGDELFTLNPSGSYTPDTYTSTGWSTGSAPVPAVGEGFWYYSVAPSGENWVYNFSVN